MHRALYSLFLILVLLAMPALGKEGRTFEFTYAVLAGDFPGTEAVDIYLPLPARHQGQRIISERMEVSLPGERGTETDHGNHYYHIRRPANVNAPISATLSWTVQRDWVETGDDTRLSEQERQRYLAADALVPVGHEILQPILAEIRAQRVDDSADATARAIYDWVVDNVEYKKVGTGWGNGDTFWACSERYGNCTDFHALFVSLARSEGIPARFEIGFPVPQDGQAGTIKGYHCWVQFYLEGQGWVPIDASEAAKHPEKRELYYGAHPADRIHFTTGRDLVVSEASAALPLNYFIYPYVEVGGKPWRAKVQTRFTYREVKDAGQSVSGD